MSMPNVFTLGASGVTHAFGELNLDEAKFQLAANKIDKDNEAGQVFHALHHKWSWSEPPMRKRRKALHWPYNVIALCQPVATFEIREWQNVSCIREKCVR